MLLIADQLQVERCVWFKRSLDKSAYITLIRQSGRENAQHPDLLFIIHTPRSYIGKEGCISNVVLFGSSTHTHTHSTSGFPRLACGITLWEVLNTEGLQWMSPYQHHDHRWIVTILSHKKSTLGTYSKPKHNVALRVTAVDVQAEALQMEVYWNMISHPMKQQRVVKRIQPKKMSAKSENNRRMAKRAICVVHLSIRDRSLGWVYPHLFFLGAMGRPTYDHQHGIIQKFQDITYDIHHPYLQCTSLVLSWM